MRPKLTPQTEYYWRAFCDLITDRPPAFSGIPCIPWSSVDRWAVRHGIANEEFDTLLAMIRAADDEYIKLNTPPETGSLP